MKRKWNHFSIIGITDDETVMLDFDKTPFKWVKYWAHRTMNWFNLEGFIILKSSQNCYHVVFDKKVSWIENVTIMAWVSLLSRSRGLTKWFLMQCIKQAPTLRVSPKRDKPSPRIIYRYGKQDSMVKEFSDFRKIIKNMLERLNGELKLNGKLKDK